MVRKWSTVPISLSYITLSRCSVNAISGGEPVDTRSSPSKPISRMAYYHAFGTYYEVMPCPCRAELTGGQPQSQPAHNQWSGWYPLHRQQERSVDSIHWRPEYTAPFPAVRTHARTHTRTYRYTMIHHYRYAHVHHFRYAHADETTPIAPR
jgi:hypothetical protein